MLTHFQITFPPHHRLVMDYEAAKRNERKRRAIAEAQVEPKKVRWANACHRAAVRVVMGAEARLRAAQEEAAARKIKPAPLARMP